MGLFGLGKPKQDAQVNWLNKVDLAYQHAFQVKNAAGLEQYLTRKCLMSMVERIRLGEKAYSGIARYQRTEWTKGEVKPDSIVYIKSVKYDNIQMSHGITVPVGDSCKERWVIVNDNGANKIAEIRKVQ